MAGARHGRKIPEHKKQQIIKGFLELKADGGSHGELGEYAASWGLSKGSINRWLRDERRKNNG